ncbi:MAG TPA: hypothetical protein DCP69_07180 [Candidatus Omnitrophica bacterium]|nr:hypothetical protein [Candidatus Omnitrophota bacterium]
MCRGKPHKPEVKAAVMAALLAGQGASEVAKTYHLPQGTVEMWKTQLHGASNLKKVDLSELIESTLRAFLDTVRVQVAVAQDPAWVRQQTASELGVFIGILSDKAFRILEAANGSNSGEAPADGGSG